MFKLVVLSALLAVVAGSIGHASIAYSTPDIAIPSAVSYQSRSDIVNKPIVATTAYAAAAPAAVAYSVPDFAAVRSVVAPVAVPYFAPSVTVPSAVSYQSRTDVVSKPVVATTTYAAAPVVRAAPLAAAPAISVPSAVTYQSRTDVVDRPVVAETTYGAATSALTGSADFAYSAGPAFAAYPAYPAVVSAYNAPAVVKSASLW